MNKILIDEAVVRRFVYATAMVVDCAQLEDWQVELYDKAGADLDEALADAALDKMADNARELGVGLTDDGKFFCDGKSCKQPAQQEPVAWMHEWADGEKIPLLTPKDERDNDQPISVRPLVYGDTTPPAQEPDPDELTIAYMSGVYEGKKRKPWVGLTDEERLEVVGKKWWDWDDAVDIDGFIGAIEAKLKEKNT